MWFFYSSDVSGAFFSLKGLLYVGVDFPRIGTFSTYTGGAVWRPFMVSSVYRGSECASSLKCLAVLFEMLVAYFGWPFHV